EKAGRTHVGLPHPHGQCEGLEALDERVRDCGRERLEQVVPPLVHLGHEARHVAVVDRFVDAIGRAAVADLERDVVEEALPVPALALVEAVEAVELEARELYLHAPTSTACAAVSASTCSRPRWTRKIAARCWYAATAAPTEAAVVPVVADGSPMIRPSELFRDTPTSTGRPIAASSSSRRSSSKLCATVFPNPIPGSRQT